jgi:hypothetical protein
MNMEGKAGSLYAHGVHGIILKERLKVDRVHMKNQRCPGKTFKLMASSQYIQN